MELLIFQNLSTTERVEMLKKHCSKAEKISYNRNLTEAEIEAESKKLADAVTSRARVEEEKSEVMKGYKSRIDDLKKKAEIISETLLSGQKEETSLCYKFVNLDTREVGYYNEHGELVKVRTVIDQDIQLDMFDEQNQDHAKLQGKQQASLPEAKHPEAEDVEFEEVNDK